MSKAAQFRKLIKEVPFLIMPGVYDCLTAKIVENNGFPAIWLGDGTISVSVLGQPDFGILSVPEIIGRARDICNAVKIPAIVDIATGGGGPINVQGAVRAVEALDAAGVFFEDQQWPKKCGHIEGRKLIPLEEMVSKVRAAVDVRNDPDFLIVARTDARRSEGLDGALERLHAYHNAGADIGFIDALESMEDLEQAANKLQFPLMVNMLEGGKTPYLSAHELEKLGYKIGLWPETLLYAGFRAMMNVARELKETGTVSAESRISMADFVELSEFLGLRQLYALEKRYAVVS